MNWDYLSTVVLAPIVSEKSTMIADTSNQVAFKVRTDARKLDIKRAVEAMFDVKVDRVNVANMRGKRKGSVRAQANERVEEGVRDLE